MVLNLNRIASYVNFTWGRKVCKTIQTPLFRQMVMPGANPLQCIHTDLSMSCPSVVPDQSLYPDPEAMDSEEVKQDLELKEMPKGNGVPIFVMLPLDTSIAFRSSVMVNGYAGDLKDCIYYYKTSLVKLKNAGVEGAMVDIWWGLVEGERPLLYNWSGYTELMDMARELGLKVQAVMSFHQCGGNVGDSVMISLPKWVVKEMERNCLCYCDQWGRHNCEYVSLSFDTNAVLEGRTPVQCYADFMQAFGDQFASYLGTTIIEIQVGMGPAGELRYASYPEEDGIWKFPGIRAFQSFDKDMLTSLNKASISAGKPEWGHSGPTDAGGYNSWPHDTSFFCDESGSWNGPYGEFFLSWYSQILIEHADRILSSAVPIFSGNLDIKISVKIAGIHWHYGTMSHAPELTAGYYNTRFRDGYLPIAKMLARHRAVFNFTCLEMRDCEQPDYASCMPEALVRQVAAAAREAGVSLAAENALPRYDEQAFEQIINVATSDDLDNQLVAFTYLRMNPKLFEEDNWHRFVSFVERMRKGKDRSQETGHDGGK